MAERKRRPMQWFKFDPTVVGTVVEDLDLCGQGAYFKLMRALWLTGPLAEADVRRKCGTAFQQVRELMCSAGEGLSFDWLEALRSDAQELSKTRAEVANIRHSKQVDAKDVQMHAIALQLPSISKSSSKSKEGKELKNVVTTKLEFDGFRERCLKVHKDVKLLSDAEAKAFFDYWTEGHPETKPRYATMDKFDIAKRMGTWKRNNFAAKPTPPAISPTAKPWMQ